MEEDMKNDEAMEEEKENSNEKVAEPPRSPHDEQKGVKSPAPCSFYEESVDEEGKMGESEEEGDGVTATTMNENSYDQERRFVIDEDVKELSSPNKTKEDSGMEEEEEEEENERPNTSPELNEKPVIVEDVKLEISDKNERNDGDREEGELEEGELEDEEGEEAVDEKRDEENSEREQNKENRDTLKMDKNKDPTRDKDEGKDKKGREERKRKHKEHDEKKKKKRKHHYSSEEEETQKKKFPPGRDNPYDFDTLLKQEMYLVGGGPNPEGSASPEDEQYRGLPFQGHSQFNGPNEGESYESVSGEEWEEKPRPRMKRKRRGSRSPSRKNELGCVFYRQGSCKRGSECPYSHEGAPTRKMELCKFYMMDCCAKKEKCLYMHKDFPCKYYHFGMKCKAGELCKFSHESLREITRTILLKHIELAPKDILGDFPRVSKMNAHVILRVTEAKRTGEPVDLDGLENVLDLEGKGFKYLDRVLKNMRKRKDGDKKGEEDRDREDKERSPKKIKIREDHRDSDKDRDREKEGGIGRERERERPRERDLEREQRKRERGRHRSKGEYPSHMSQKQREFSHRLEQSSQHPMDEPRSRDGHGRLSFDSRGGPNHSADPATKWYSSDEEGENGQGFRRSHNYGSPQERRHRSGEGPSHGTNFQGMQQGHSQGFSHAPFPGKSNLDNIDVSYLKNVLSTVHSQASQNTQPSYGNHGDQDIRSSQSSSWAGDSRGIKSPLREARAPSSSYLDMANDIKEVFYDGPDVADDLSRSVDSLLRNARGRASAEQEMREGRPFRNFRDSYPSQNDSNWNQGPNSREDSMSSRDLIQQEGYRGENTDDRNFGRDPRYFRENFVPWKGKRDRDSLDTRDPTIDSKYLPRGDFEFQEGGQVAKEDTDLRLLHSIAGGKPPGDMAEGPDSKASNRSPVSSTSGGDRPASSIYDFDLRQLESLKMAESVDDLGTLPFKVPTHSAKEIDASMNPRTPIYYQLIEVDIPKPDFSRLKINPDDPKIFNDPRLRKMLRRNSTDDPACSPRSGKLDTDVSLGSPTYESKLKFPETADNRDPRRNVSRDPRADSKGLNRMDSRGDPRQDPRVDPRMANRTDPRSDPRIDPRGDPRGMNARFDPRMDNRDPRMDIRENLMDSDMRDGDPRIGGPVFVNGMMEGPNYPHFANMGAVSIDPRGRPGLLGPAPGQGPKNLPMGLPGQMPQSMGTNHFLIPQGMGGGPAPYMSGDRGDMMGVSGTAFPQGQWSGGRGNFNDPRLNRDLDMGSFTPSSVS